MRLASLIPLLLVGACAASSSDVTSTESAVAGQDICKTLDYGPRPAPNDAYFFFADPAAATTYMQGLDASGYLKANGGPNAKLDAIQAPDSRLGKLIAEVYRGYQLAFPLETAGLDTPPPVALVTSDIVNAYVLTQGIGAAPGDQQKAPWIFVVQSALSDFATDDELRAVVAHELGHLVLRNIVTEVRQLFRVSYQIGPAGEDRVFGETQANVSMVDEHLNWLRVFESRVGSVPELGFDPTYSSLYGQLLQPLYDASPACTEARAASVAVHDALRPFIASAIHVPAADDLTRIAGVNADYETKAERCFAASTDQRTLAADIAAAFQMTIEQATSALLDSELAIDADSTIPSLPLRLLHAAASARSQQLELASDPTMPKASLRYYDAEEDADDAAVRVLLALRHDTTGLSSFMLSMLPTADRTTCTAQIAAGAAIPYGRLNDPHHDGCWRAYHVTNLGQTLATCHPSSAKLPLRTPIDVPPLAPLPIVSSAP